MLQTVGKHPEGQRFDSGYSLLTSRAVNHHSREVRNLRQPTAIFFLFDFDVHNNGKKIAPSHPPCRTQTPHSGTTPPTRRRRAQPKRGNSAHSKGFASSLAGSHVAKRMECVQLAGAFELAGPYESGSKLHAVQTLRGSRTGLLAHDGLQALPQDGDQFFMGGVGFRVGQGALGASVSEGVGHAFLAWRNVLAPEDVEQLD